MKSMELQLPRRPEWEPDKEHIRFFGRADKPEGVLIHHDQAAIAWWGYEEDRADYWEAKAKRLQAQVESLKPSGVVYSTGYCHKHLNWPWSMTCMASTVGASLPKIVCPICEPPPNETVFSSSP